MMELLHAANVPLGLLTNGEHWMLVYAPRGETTGFASWYADLWVQEPITLRAFQSLLHLRRFLGVAADETLPALFAASSKDQQEVTDQLGYQVRRAVEMLVQAFDRIDAELGRQLLAGMPEKELYDSALTVMMRLVFLFSAEERKLLLLGDPLYDQHYAVSTLSELLRERADQHGEEVLERRHDAWCRLLATFRAVFAGVQHEGMRLPGYGGTLFDPDRYPFLEGRAKDTKWTNTAAKPLPINNRVVLHLLEALQLLRVKVPGGGPAEARRLSFRALDIEQIGHVYEGLLDHTAKRAPELILGLAGSKDKEPEIPLSKLEEFATKGTVDLVEFLHEETGKSENGLKRLLGESSEIDDHTLLIACRQDALLFQRVRPFAALLREDSFGQFVVVPEGSVYVTRGSDRRSTGTHYTPRSLTEPIVQYTLEPLVYVGPAEGKPKEEWQLKSPKELLDLKVCDMAMGSGAFLVQACRYLAERLVEAWEKVEKEHAGTFVTTPEGEISTGSVAERLIPADAAERLAIARRTVADRCLYGVDINPMAVEMAKLSLWLITLQRDRPFTFLNHALKCGDSLLGASSVQQIENFSLRPGEHQMTFATANLFRYVEAASDKRRALEDLPSNHHTQIETKNRLHAEAEAATAKVKALADCLIAFELRGLDSDAYEEQRADEAEKLQLLIKHDVDAGIETANPQSQLARTARESLRAHRTFHWPVEFPEVFARGGFDAFVGNPPFMGGTRLEPVFGTDFREYLVERIACGVRGMRGAADLCSYFFLRASQLLSSNGSAGLIGTNSLAQGDSATVGLERIVNSGAQIYRANSSSPWPGAASLEVAHVWFSKRHIGITPMLDGREVSSISAHLSEEGATIAFTLEANAGQAFEGAKTAGMGFVITEEEAHQLLSANPDSREVVKPYLNGEDVNTHPEHCPSRWIINFRDFPLERDESIPHCSPVARDFPDALSIVESRVKPERMQLEGRTPQERTLKERWWQFYLWRPAMTSALAGRSSALVSSRVTAHHNFVLVPTNVVFSDRLVVIAREDWGSFAIISSSIHAAWAHRPGATTHETRLTYLPTWAYSTFPFPPDLRGLETVGEAYSRYRRQLMLARREGLTRTYNRLHDPKNNSEDIARLRALHLEMDQAVAAAYGWIDLDLGHRFRDTKQGVRYTLSEPARRTVLDRLLALNHQRYEEEVRAGLHKRKGKSGKGRRKAEGMVQEDEAEYGTLKLDF
ncbi:Eco57I restriction-modification methylase domain-containing protein [Nitrospira defluvii]|nr:DNA methyltransferase [Nitrospira defluvii]